MDNEPSTSGEPARESVQDKEQSTIFQGEEFSLEGYDKNIKNARIALFVVAGVQVLVGIYSAWGLPRLEMIVALTITIGIGLVFFVLGLWTKKKPYTAIVTGLVFFIVMHLLEGILDPATIFKGLLMKVLVIVYLSRSLGDAREAQENRKNFKF